MLSDGTDPDIIKSKQIPPPQCNFFVLRKKRLCRMTVRPGRQYCGEHEPQPKTEDGMEDTRIPCPNDPKHTCYASKLEKHLTICNARATEQPDYIIHNVNIPKTVSSFIRTPLSEVDKETLQQVVAKVNILYDKYVKHEIKTQEELPIHWTVLPEFNEPARTESSRRHLRQTSSLLHLIEAAGLVQDHTCYVELGAGKGLVSYYMWQAWCRLSAASVLLVDRAAPRHKRDNKLGARVRRLRADLAHLALHAAPAACDARAVVGVAKHLCGVATDYALHCVTAPGVVHKTSGVVMATCCHHRCDPAVFMGREQLQNLGVTDEELNVILGIVSWATCGDGRPRDRRPAHAEQAYNEVDHDVNDNDRSHVRRRAETGARAKALLDWARAAALRARGLRAALTRFVPRHVSPENLAIVAVRTDHTNDE